MFKYPKDKRQVTTENISFDTEVITETNGKRVALLPGGFKPPHAGHYQLAKHLSSLPDIDEVIVIIGKNPRSDDQDKISISADQSKKLWDIYTRKDNNIKVRIQTGKTPVADVYDLIANPSEFSEGDTVILGKSDKDTGDTRFARAQSYAERNNPGVNVEEVVVPVFGGSGMGGTPMRNLIANNQQNKFFSKLPLGLSDKEREQIWNIVTGISNEALDRLIDDHLKEISTMSGGSVQGSMHPSGFGPPNQYNPYKRSKVKKPAVKRAKRQRRR